MAEVPEDTEMAEDPEAADMSVTLSLGGPDTGYNRLSRIGPVASPEATQTGLKKNQNRRVHLPW